jgi:hypothetical protein
MTLMYRSAMTGAWAVAVSGIASFAVTQTLRRQRSLKRLWPLGRTP